MTDFSALPLTFDVLVKRPVTTAATRFYRISLHSTDYESCLDEVEALFPGVDARRLRRIYEGKEKPGVGISGDVSIINTDHYTMKGRSAPPETATRRKTRVEVMTTVASAAVAVNRDLHETIAVLAGFERRGVIPPEWHAVTADKLVKWSCLLAEKIAGLAQFSVAPPPAPALTGEWPFAVGGGVELPLVELTLEPSRNDGPAWGEPLPLSHIKC